MANFVLALIIFFLINIFIGKDMTPAIIDEVQKANLKRKLLREKDKEVKKPKEAEEEDRKSVV